MNMRKIIAMLAAMMLLCTAIPMGALSVAAAPGDVILDINFDDGSNGGFERSYNENGYIVFDATTADWQNTYAYKSGFQTNVDYVVTFKAKANKDTTMNFKINDNWGPDAAAFTVNVTTEWQEFEGIINMASLSGAIVMFSSNAPAADAATYYIDDLKIVEKKVELEVGKIINGDFENGDLSGWNHHQSTAISTDAHSGSYAANIKGNGGWGGLLDQNVSVEAGKTYAISIWVKAIANGTNIQVKDGGTDGANLESTWFTATEWTELTWEVTPTTNVICFNFCGGGNGLAEDVLVDDITIAEVKQPSFDGYVYNGDFEIGELSKWNHHQGTVITTDAHSGSYAANIKGNGGWGGMLDQDITVEAGKTYKISLWAKTIANGVNVQVQDGPAGTKVNLASTWFTKTEWTELSWEVIPTTNVICINFCGGGNGIAEDVLVDDIKIIELKDASDDGFVINGDFETGAAAPWTLYSGTAVSAEAAYTGNFGLYIKNPTGGWGGTAFQDFSVEVGKSYEVTMWAKNLNGARGQNIQIQNGGATVASKWFDNTTAWTLLTFEFTATAENCRINICGGGTNANEEMYVDDIKVKELKQPSNDGYIINGDFETGEVFPWDNLWGSCSVVEIVEGMDGGYGLHIVSGQWKHVRQTNIAVEANTNYKITAWVKNAANMSLLVKDGGDSKDIVNAGVSAGDEWTEITKVFNTGDYTTIIFSLMGGAGEDGTQYGTFDNIKIEKHEHEYVGVVTEEPTCELTGTLTYTCECGATNGTEEIPAYHNGGLEYHAAVEAIDCANPGNIEYWFCPGCYEYFADAEATEYINPWYIEITVDCVRPEGIADCATVTCETCGNEIYGYGEHDVLVCQGGTCSKCGENIEGVGCQNFDTPACEDGVCYYCGGFVAGFGHENGAWAACCDGECAYGCGLIYPATEDHIDEDGDGYCDNCWNAMPHDCIDEDGDNYCDICWEMMPHDCVDADGDGWCDICWSEMPAADIMYGDVNGDGEVAVNDAALLQQYLSGYDVDVDLAAADVNGDGEVAVNDAALLQQYLSGYDVVLGPQG